MVEMSAEGIAVIAPFSFCTVEGYAGIELTTNIDETDPAALDSHGIFTADSASCIAWYMMLISVLLCFLDIGILHFVFLTMAGFGEK